MRTSTSLVLALACGIVAGCAKSPDTTVVTGTVRFKNQTLTAGTVVFQGENKVGTGAIAANGTYRIPDAPVGAVKIGVTVSAPTNAAPPGTPLPEGPSAVKAVPIPALYREPMKSGLTFTVARGQQSHDIDMK